MKFATSKRQKIKKLILSSAFDFQIEILDPFDWTNCPQIGTGKFQPIGLLVSMLRLDLRRNVALTFLILLPFANTQTGQAGHSLVNERPESASSLNASACPHRGRELKQFLCCKKGSCMMAGQLVVGHAGDTTLLPSRLRRKVFGNCTVDGLSTIPNPLMTMCAETKCG